MCRTPSIMFIVCVEQACQPKGHFTNGAIAVLWILPTNTGQCPQAVPPFMDLRLGGVVVPLSGNSPSAVLTHHRLPRRLGHFCKRSPRTDSFRERQLVPWDNEHK